MSICNDLILTISQRLDILTLNFASLMGLFTLYPCQAGLKVIKNTISAVFIQTIKFMII